MLQQGTKLNDTYTLVEQLGSGGGGIVYKAYHERLRTYVVVKQIREKVKGILESRAEADILKNIKHTRLPRVYDFLEIDNEVFTVMDFIPGVSLDHVLEAEGRCSPKEVYRWLLQLAEALKYLHSQTPPVIHSDIKPANVMLTPERDICLIDFNVSLAFDQGMRTSAGVSGGYSPPEQYRDFGSYCSSLPSKAGTETGDTQTVLLDEETLLMESGLSDSDSITERVVESMVGRGVDERSDIFSLGATIYHLLTGVKPPRDFEAIVPITGYLIDVSEGFNLIIQKMMALDPEKRYQNGGELLSALEHIYELDSEYQAYRRKGRRRTVLLASLYVTGAVMLGTGWMTMKRETMTAYNRAVERAGELIEAASFEEAEDEIARALSLLPGEMAAYEKETLRLYAMGAYEEAVRYGRDVIHNPAYSINDTGEEGLLGDIYYIIGNSYFEQKDYSNAIQCFREAIGRNQKNSKYFSDYAIALAKTGNIENAQEALEAAISLGLGQDSVYMAQGEIALAKGEAEVAVRHLQASIRATDDHDLRRRATIMCAQAYETMGDEYLDQEIALLEEAEKTFSVEVSMHISEELADAYARKARLSEELGIEYYPRALETFQALYERGYSTRQMMENIAILYQQMNQMEEAEAMFGRLIEAYPEDYRGYKRLAFLEADKQQRKVNEDRDYQLMKQQYDKALELYEESGREGDTEMQMLETMLKDLRDGGWF